MQIIKKFDKQANYIFLVSILIHLVIMCVGYSEFEVPLRGRLLQLAFGLGGIKILMTYYEKIEWVFMILLGVIGVLSYLFTKEKYVLYVVVLIFSAKSVDMGKVIKHIAYAALVALLANAVLSLVGIGGPVSRTLEYRPGTVETRYCFGFSHPNNVHGTLWYILSLMIFIYRDRLDWRHYTVFMGANVGLYLLTDSKAGVLVSTLIIIAGVCYKYIKTVYSRKWVYGLAAMAFLAILVLTLISITVCSWYGYGPVLSKIDSLLTGRVSIAYNNARMSWWNLFDSYRRDKDIVDNGYAALGVTYGYVVWLTYIAFNGFLLYVSAHRKDGILLGIIMTAIGYTFMESTYMLNSVYLLNNLLYIVAMCIWNRGLDRGEAL